MRNFSTKEKRNIIYIAVFLVVLTVVFFWYLANIKEPKQPIIEPPSWQVNQESEVQKQTRELEELRNQNKDQDQKDIETQTKELEALRKNSQPLTEEQIKEQTDELNKARLEQ